MYNKFKLCSPFSFILLCQSLFSCTFKCNAAIEGLNDSRTLLPLIKQQLLGEAKFMRAFFYFYLVNMFGDVPLALSTDPEINTNLSRSAKADVYKQIKKDLLEAKEALNDNFLDVTLLKTTLERVRPTKWAASALLARVYLFTGEWAAAETESSLIISKSAMFSLPNELNDVFLKNSREAIWQIQPTDASYNTVEARALIIPSVGPTNNTPVQLHSMLLNSFEVGDKRAINGNWVNSVTSASGTVYTFPFKYKINLPNSSIAPGSGTANMSEYFMVLRLAEQYLIRAEARSQLGNFGGAQSDLNIIRHRAGLGDTPANDQASLLTAILNERRHELFSEWGHRWLDLKRTGKVDEVMTIATPIKSNGATQWQSYQQLYPLPLTELQRAPNLVQNSGY